MQGAQPHVALQVVAEAAGQAGLATCTIKAQGPKLGVQVHLGNHGNYHQQGVMGSSPPGPLAWTQHNCSLQLDTGAETKLPEAGPGLHVRPAGPDHQLPEGVLPELGDQ